MNISDIKIEDALVILTKEKTFYRTTITDEFVEVPASIMALLPASTDNINVQAYLFRRGSTELLIPLWTALVDSMREIDIDACLSIFEKIDNLMKEGDSIATITEAVATAMGISSILLATKASAYLANKKDKTSKEQELEKEFDRLLGDMDPSKMPSC
jgi:hypothetical protein